MASPAEPRPQVQFAEFVLDLRTGELWRNDEKLALPPQSFQVLAVLLQKPGELVTREELVRCLWASDVFVEFEGSLNKAVKRLREVLQDSADHPRFIETLPRRGYRFIASLQQNAGFVVAREGLIGRRVSHYRVLQVIGGGGMGLVYKAEDLKLGRRVALKFLPDELATDSVALQRFEREAQTASSLNHPNICTIHEVEEHDGQPFIVMELLDGVTLRDCLASSGDLVLPLDELLNIATQICDGLRAAHQKGIIHRDIKPANIFLTTSGQVKILDFGLAKLVVGEDATETTGLSTAGGTEALKGHGFARADIAPSSLESRGSQLQAELKPARGRNSATLNGTPEGMLYQSPSPAHGHLTRTGSAMGTAGYMSPEQVRGETLDARTDLFSFGLVLYEMATGQRAFSGETAAVVHDAIVKNAPVPVRDLNSTLPAKLVATIGKALEKDREQRYQSAAEVRADLEVIRSGKPAKGRRRWKWFTAAALLLAIAAGAGLYWQSRNNLTLASNDTIVLADFTNVTADPIFDDALNTALRVELEQTPFLNVLAPDKVRGILTMLKHPKDERLTPDLGREVCRRTASKALVTGLITDVGNHYRIELAAVDCQSGKTLARTRNEAANRSEVIRVLGIAGHKLRSELGEPKALSQKFNKPLEEATSPSLEALQAYSRGRVAQFREGDVYAIPDLQRATEFDPNFAMAYEQLAAAHGNMEQTTAATQNYKRAYALRDRMNQRQQFNVDVHYYAQVTGELDKTFQTYAEWIQTYPYDSVPHANLPTIYDITGEYEKELAEYREVLRLAPGNLQALAGIIRSYYGLNRLEDAKVILDNFLAQKPDSPVVHEELYTHAFIVQDHGAMAKESAWGNGKPEIKGLLATDQSGAAAYYGRFAEAQMFANLALEDAAHTHSVDAAANLWAEEALRNVEVGKIVQARQAANQAMALLPDRDVRVMSAWALARAGDVSRAEELAAQLEKDFPLDTYMHAILVPSIRAAIELSNNNPDKAVELLRTMPYELGHTPGSLPNLFPLYVRGLAYLQAGRGEQAAADFQKIIDHPGVVYYFIVAPLSRLQLGRAQVRMGDKAAARKSYQDFLTLWKDADPDIPIYQQAKAEYARLR